MIAVLSLLVCIIGALAYALSANGKIQELGRLAYFAGLLTFLLNVGTFVVSWMPRR